MILDSVNFGGGGDPIGAIKMGVAMPANQWLPCNGQSVTRAAWPSLSPQFPMGALTGTARASFSSSTNPLVATSPTYFVASSGSNSAQSVQYSADGATWSKAGVVTASDIVASIIWAGSRWIALFSGAIQPMVTTGDNPGSTWVTTTTGPSSTVSTASGLAYSPSLGMTVAHLYTTVWTLADGATAWVHRGTPVVSSPNGVVWTGQDFIIPSFGATNYNVARSSDGITWTIAPTGFGAAASNPPTPNAIASNGNGVVVVCVTQGTPKVSVDHGLSWFDAGIPGYEVGSTNVTSSISYSGDRFFLSTPDAIFMSFDGITWFIERNAPQGHNGLAACAKKGTAIVQVATPGYAYSYTESATAFNTPLVPSFTYQTAQRIHTQAPYYIKGA